MKVNENKGENKGKSDATKSPEPRYLHTAVQGSGPTMICLHGLSGSHLNWNRLSRSLSPHFKMVAFDFIGHAKSAAPHDPSAYQIDAVLEDIDQQISQQSEGKAILCGLSMGAAAMLLYTLRHPEKVSALILTSFPEAKAAQPTNQAPNTAPNTAKTNTVSIASIASEFADAILKEGLDASGERFVWGAESPFSKRDGQLIKQGFTQHTHPHGLAYCMREFLAKLPDQKTILNQVSSLTVPTLLIAGSKDHGSLQYAHALSKALPKEHHQLIVIENGGHLVNIDSVQRYNSAVSDFLSHQGLTHH